MGSEEEGPLPPLYVAPHHEVAASCILDFLPAKSAAFKKIKLFFLPKFMLEVYNLPLDPADMDGRMTVHVADQSLRLTSTRTMVALAASSTRLLKTQSIALRQLSGAMSLTLLMFAAGSTSWCSGKQSNHTLSELQL